MLRISCGLAGLTLALGLLVGCNETNTGIPGPANGGDGQAPAVEIGSPLYGTGPQADTQGMNGRGTTADPVVIADCRFVICDRQEVPSLRDGSIRFIATELKPGQQPPADRRVYKITVGTEDKSFYQLKEGDRVQDGDLMALLDTRLAFDDWNIKDQLVAMAELDKKTSEATRDEAYQRYLTSRRIRGGKESDEETRGAFLTYERYVHEANSKGKAIEKSRAELRQAETIMKLHEVRSGINGRIRRIYKNKDEAIKSHDPVFQVDGTDRIKIEGLVEQQYLPRLSRAVKVVIEPTQPESPTKSYLGHLQEVTCVAVSQGPKMLIVSGSEDGTARVWDRELGHERRLLRHPAAVRAVACTGPDASRNLCLTGATDGQGRIWDLDDEAESGPVVLQGSHRGGVTCVAFSPDGQWCLTGGDDREIILWNTTTGEQKYAFPAGHRGGVTTVRFTPQSQVLSAGRDNTLRLWTVGEHGARLETTIDRRSGEVADIGVSPDGKVVLYDQGKRLSLLSIPGSFTMGTLENTAGSHNFSTFAQFSPDGQLIATAGASEGRVQLWRAPSATSRAYELRQLIAPDRGATTCAAFAPDGSFLVTGTRDRQVLVWPVPGKEDMEKEIVVQPYQLKWDPTLESGGRQMRIWAEFANIMDDAGEPLLVPGSTATVTVYTK